MGVLERIYLGLHRATYARRLARQRRFPQFHLVSVGNLSVGGTGKTPVVRLLARHATAPCVILRGYGGRLSRRGALVSDGTYALVGWQESGDEAALYARTPGLRVAVGRDRAAVIERFAGEATTVFLDDAFQNPSVFRDHELVLVDATASGRKLELLPWGRMREPWEALERADTVLLTRVAQAAPDHLRFLEERIATFVDHEAIFHADHVPTALRPPLEGEVPLGAFCGIGNPKSFFQSLDDLGLESVHQEVFSDHHAYTVRDVEHLLRVGRTHGLVWVTTEKDAVRLEGRRDLPTEFLAALRVLPVEIEIAGGRELDFVKRVLGPTLLPGKN